MEANEFEREEILNQAYNFEKFAVRDGVVVIKHPDGRIRLTEEAGLGLILITSFPDDDTEGVKTFWMNISSLHDLGNKLRVSDQRRVSPDTIWI